MNDEMILLLYVVYIIPVIISVQCFELLSTERIEYFRNGRSSFIKILRLCFIPIFNIYLMYDSIKMIIKHIEEKEKINDQM